MLILVYQPIQHFMVREMNQSFLNMAGLAKFNLAMCDNIEEQVGIKEVLLATPPHGTFYFHMVVLQERESIIGIIPFTLQPQPQLPIPSL